MTSATSSRYYSGGVYDDTDASSDSLRAEGREPGARRRKLAGYLKAANELRQAYQQAYVKGWSGGGDRLDYPEGDDTPGAFPDAAIVRSGHEEMILFPSYARHHVKRKPQAVPGTIQETAGAGRDARDAAGAGDAEFWKKEFEKYEDDNAIVDVDVRGWIYSPHRGQMTRRHRLFVGLARQLVGLPTPSTKSSGPSSRDPSPHKTHGERVQERNARQEEELIEREAMTIMKKGESEAAKAEKGGYSEDPSKGADTDSLYAAQSRSTSPVLDPRRGRTAHELTPTHTGVSPDEPPVTGIRKTGSWTQPSQMSQAELQTANSHLMSRLKPFLANPLANTPISVFFYNDQISRQRTIYTDGAGHFSVRAALEFIPTHVRILASENLSATTEVHITEPKGISLISDIDDTIKHSAISSGAREIFRNAFIRELGDLTIEGVREWYGAMYEKGVRFHYVSNSPWQLFPIIQKYFALAGLPAGSFHLKQYSGMLQGIFEPVAERKKATLDRLSRDFPERSFILVGDSGEADLEVYTDFVLENPGRVIAVFIRDVTTSTPKGFFDPSMGPLSGDKGFKKKFKGTRSARSSRASEDDDPELRAAILASLRDMNQAEGRYPVWTPGHSPSGSVNDLVENRPALPPRGTSSPAAPEMHRIDTPESNLIEFSDDEDSVSDHPTPPLPRSISDTAVENTFLSPIEEAPLQRRNAVKRSSGAPVVPRKPLRLRSVSQEKVASPGRVSPAPRHSSPASRKLSPVPGRASGKASPPPIRRPSTSVKANLRSGSPLSQPPHVPESPEDAVPKLPPRTNSGLGAAARNKLAQAYNSLPATSALWNGTSGSAPSEARAMSTASPNTSEQSPGKKAPPPPPPPRRTGTNISNLSASAKDYASSHLTNIVQSNSPSRQPYSTTSNDANESTTSLNLTKRPTNSSQISVGTTNTVYGGPTNGGGNGGGAGAGSGSKREELWRKRWLRAQQVLGEKGVVLRSWRVGTDVMDEALALIEETLERQRREHDERRRDSEGRELGLWREKRVDSGVRR